MQMEQTLKVFYNGSEEVRKIKFNFQEGYTTLLKKLQATFNFTEGEYSLQWKDLEGDFIRISSDADLHMMLAEQNSETQSDIKLYLKKTRPLHSNSHIEHPGVVCDGCSVRPLCGNRYKCLECADYDLCEPCMQRGEHADHNMILLRSSEHPFFGRRHCRPHFVGAFKGGRRCHWKESSPSSEREKKKEEAEKVTACGNEGNSECAPMEVSAPTAASTAPNTPVESTNRADATVEATPPNVRSEAAKNSEYLAGSGLAMYPNLFQGFYPPQPAIPTTPTALVNVPQAVREETKKDETGSVQSALPPPVSNARGHMLNMGFNDENGWLTQLLMQNNGDISKCLDEMYKRHRMPQ